MRLFIAFLLPEDVRAELVRVSRALSKQTEGVKWVAPENLHLTIRFLGETRRDQVESIEALLSKILVSHRPISGTLNTSPGAFPSLIRPRAIWAGVDGDLSEASKLVNEIETGIRSLGVEPERKSWSPHITLGRVRDGIQLNSRPLTAIRLTPLEVSLEKVTLFESRLSSAGPTNHSLRVWSLTEELFS